MPDYDLVVIGGGAGGLSAARAAQREKAKVLLINDGPLGGDCTFTGCVPSKTLISAAARGASFSEAVAEIHRIVDHIAATEDADVLRSEGVDVLEGRARYLSPIEIDVDGTRIAAPKSIIATGARASIPPIPGLREMRYLTNEDVFDLTAAPASLGVLGGGPIGAELAQAFARLGVRVTLFEALDRVLAKEEPEASVVVLDALIAAGVVVRLGQFVTAVDADGDHGAAAIRTEGGAVVRVEKVLVAVGRSPITEGLGLEEIGVATDDRGFVETQEDLSTTVNGIWAVGDVNGRLPFTHAAYEMGTFAAWNAVARRKRTQKFNAKWIPWVTFTDPEVARVGMSEAEAPSNARVAFLPMGENDRGLTAGRTEGFVKLIFGPKMLTRNLGGGQVLGATIVAPTAGEMIHEPVLAMRTKMFAGRLAQTVHAYPSWSIGIQKAAAQFFFEVEGRSARKVRS